MKIYPVHDRILVRRDEADGISRGGIILPDQSKEKPLRGVIEAIGPGKMIPAPLSPQGFVLQPIPFKVGEHILFAKYAGDSYKTDGEEWFLVRAEDVVAVLGYNEEDLVKDRSELLVECVA